MNCGSVRYTSVRAVTRPRPQAPAHLEDLLQILTDNLQVIRTNHKLFPAYDKRRIQELVDHLITIRIQFSIWGLREKAHYVGCEHQLEQFVENSIIDIRNRVYTPNSLTNPTLPQDLQDYYCRH